MRDPYKKLMKECPHAFTKIKHVGVGAGWKMLVSQMAAELETPWQHPETAPLACFLQIKEKFGGLRMYIECVPKEYREFLADWRPAVKQARKEKYLKFRKDLQGTGMVAYEHYRKECGLAASRLYGAEAALEGISYGICEDCGSTHKVKTRGRGWVRTLCYDCHYIRWKTKS